MGRTYKRNDTYVSNRPKSLREKRNKSSRNKRLDYKQSTTQSFQETNTNGQRN